MTPRRPIAIALSGAFLLAGCHRAHLSLEPAVLEDCGPGPGKVIRAEWDARGAGMDRVMLEVLRPGAEPTPWGEAPAAGSKSTGPWGSDGLTFVVRAPDGRELDRRTVTTIPCRTPPKAPKPQRR
ncbi:MAG TPA: hypothetical protein VFT52_02625 [Luteimonas sp.]|jgi:hypothetical protein|nr:hypothetical protein [Luteimonas sp.]